MPWIHDGATPGSPRIKRGTPALWLAILIALNAYGSLLPFEFHAPDDQSAVTVMRLTFMDGGFGDAFTNVGLFFPLGFLATAWARRRRPSFWKITFVVALALGLSTLLEIGQSLTASRVGSWRDVRCNAIGALLGALMGGIWSSFAPILRARVNFAVCPYAIAAGVLFILLTVYHLLPFDAVRGSDDLANSFRRAEWTIDLVRAEARFDHLLAHLLHHFVTSSWFFALGFVLSARKSRLLSSGKDVPQTASIGIGFIVILEFLQLFSRLHTFDLTSIVLRVFAFCSGVIAFSIARGQSAWRSPRMIYKVGPGAALVIVCYLGITRLAGACDFEGLCRIGVADWPLESLWRLSTAHAALEVAEALSIYGPLCVFLFAGLVQRRGAVFNVDFVRVTVIVLMIASLIEWLGATACVPHIFDLTDPVLATAIAWGLSRVILRFLSSPSRMLTA